MCSDLTGTSQPGLDCARDEDHRRDALTKFYHGYAKLLGRRLRGAFPSLVRSPEDAEDAVQTIFLHLWRAHRALEDWESLAAYAWKTGRNVVLQENRARHALKRTPASELEQDALPVAVEGFEVWDEVPLRIYPALLKGALERLTPRQQELVEMEFCGRSRDEIRNHLGLLDSSYRVLRANAKRRLREAVLLELENTPFHAGRSEPSR